MSWGPLALHAHEARADLEDHVIATSFRYRRVNAYAELDRGMNNRCLRHRSLLITSEHVVEASNDIGWAMPCLDNLR